MSRKLPAVGTDVTDKLGLRGTLTLFESALRLIGGANATGAIAAGAAYHAFAGKAEVQASIKWAATLFLIGVFAFTLSYASWFMTSLDFDRSLTEKGGFDDLFPPVRSREHYRKSGKITFFMTLAFGIASFGCFLFGLGDAITMVTRL
jgi:hypothetical protein